MLDDAALQVAFQHVLSRAHQCFDGTPDEFDWQIATKGPVGVFHGDTADAWQELDSAIYRTANGELKAELTRPEDPTDRVGGLDGGSMRGWPDVIRKRRLREMLEPYITALVEECRAGSYTGWSRESSGPIRRIR